MVFMFSLMENLESGRSVYDTRTALQVLTNWVIPSKHECELHSSRFLQFIEKHQKQIMSYLIYIFAVYFTKYKKHQKKLIVNTFLPPDVGNQSPQVVSVISFPL